MILNLFAATLISFSLGFIAFEDCEGCEREDQVWGGGAGGESWTYNPGAGDEDGNCLPNCNYDRPCKYTGTITYTNMSGAPRDVFDPNGNLVATAGNLQTCTHPVRIKAPCGATGDAGPSFHAAPFAGTGTTSAYLFYCGGCFF